jgi:hypothetical protein
MELIQYKYFLVWVLIKKDINKDIIKLILNHFYWNIDEKIINLHKSLDPSWYYELYDESDEILVRRITELNGYVEGLPVYAEQYSTGENPERIKDSSEFNPYLLYIEKIGYKNFRFISKTNIEIRFSAGNLWQYPYIIVIRLEFNQKLRVINYYPDINNFK